MERTDKKKDKEVYEGVSLVHFLSFLFYSLLAGQERYRAITSA